MTQRTGMFRILCIGTSQAVAAMTATSVNAADMTVRQVVQALGNAPAGHVISLAGHDLSFLDLSGLDFKAARLTSANLYGADLSHAGLRKADLSNAVLDRATIVGTDFAQADLSHAVLRLPHGAASPTFDINDAPRFTGANLSHARIVARLDGADFRGADLTAAQLQSYDDWTQNAVARRSSLVACDFTAAVLVDANLAGSRLAFANFTNADLRGANLRGADLSRTNLSGAKLSGADIAGADLDGANLHGADGLEKVVGLELARNLERAVR